MIKEARMAGQKPVVNLYPLSNYTFSYTQPKRAEKDDSNATQLDRLQTKYEKEGMRTSVYGILLIDDPVSTISLNNCQGSTSIWFLKMHPTGHEKNRLAKKRCIKEAKIAKDKDQIE